MKQQKGVWLGDNFHKDSRKWEEAVRRAKQALMMAKEGRRDVERDYKQGKVYVGEKMVAKWNDVTKVMEFSGDGRDTRETYKKLMMQSRGEEDYVSDRI